MRKNTFIVLLFFIINISTFAQSRIGVTKRKGKSVEYLHFFGHGNQTLVKQLNQTFGHRQLLLDIFQEAPNEAEFIIALRNAPENVIAAQLEQAIQGQNDRALAYVSVEVGYNGQGLLCILKTVSPEGGRKVTNSVTSNYPYLIPMVYNLKNGRRWNKLSDFLTPAGQQWIRKMLLATLRHRAKKYCPDDHPRKNHCRSSGYTVSDFKDFKFQIDNGANIFSNPTPFHFYFDEVGLVIGNSQFEVARINCIAPSPTIVVPYHLLRPYCKATSQNPVYTLANKNNPSVTLKKVNVAKTYLQQEPTETINQSTPYLVKGDRVTVIEQEEGRSKVIYLSPSHIIFQGWVASKHLK